MSVTLSFFYRDSEPGGGLCKDEAEATAEAAKVAREVIESFNPSAEGTDELIREFLASHGDEDDPRYEQDERLGVSDLTDDEALDLAAEDCGFTWQILPGPAPHEPADIRVVHITRDDLPPSPYGVEWITDGVEGYVAQTNTPEQAEWLAGVLRHALGKGHPEDPAPLRQALETGLTGIADVLSKWEHGDLAGAVNGLRLWAEGTLESFPDLEAERWIAAEDLRPGDRVDMAGVYSEETGDANAAEFEYGRVYGVERETPTCVRVDFENFPTSYGFAPDRFVKAICTAKDRKAYEDAGEA